MENGRGFLNILYQCMSIKSGPTDCLTRWLALSANVGDSDKKHYKVLKYVVCTVFPNLYSNLLCKMSQDLDIQYRIFFSFLRPRVLCLAR